MQHLRESTVADSKRRRGLNHKIKPSDETSRAAVVRSPQYYFQQGLTASRVGAYSPTFRFTSHGPFDSGCSNLYSETVEPSYLCGLLSSRLMRYMFMQFVNHTVNSQVDDLKELPICLTDTRSASVLNELVASIVEKQRTDSRYPYHRHEQKEIDALIYRLYGLTEEDIREIELWFCRRYPRLAEAQGFMQEAREKYAEMLAHCERVLEKPPSYWKSHPVLALVAEGEGHKLEFKETLEVDIRSEERNRSLVQAALKNVAAFLNTDGGTLLIGVSDVGEIKGLDRDLRYSHRNNRDGFEQKLRSLLNDRFDPVPYGGAIIEFEDLPEGTICRIDIEPREGITHFDNEVFIRDGNRAKQLQGRELTDWIQTRNLR